MIIYATITAEQLSVVVIGNDNDAGATVRIEMLHDQYGGTMLAIRHIQAIDALCGPKPVYLWRSHDEMATYIRLVRRASVARIAANSVILPATMVDLIDSLGPVTPTTLRGALRAADCCTEQALRQLR